MSRRRELRKTKYFTGLSIVMLVFSVGLAIPCIIEGINIARNNYNFETNNEPIAAGSFIQTSFDLHYGQRIGIDSRSFVLDGSYWNNPAKVVISIMEEDNFTAWITDGSPVPYILNSTYYFNSSDLNVNNLIIPSYNVYHIVIYNANTVAIEIDFEISILPWDHIIAISVLGFLFVIAFTLMTTKFVTAAYFNSEDYIKEKLKKKNTTTDIENERPTKLHSEPGERFCVSCGAPLTPKDGQYCPNCGASLGN